MAMTREEALKILRDTETDFSIRNSVFKGINMISVWDHDIQFEAEHAILYVSNFDDILKKMNQRDVELMAKWGWFEEQNKWTHHL